MADEIARVFSLMGPYRDSMLTMSKTDAVKAINDRWAVEPPTGPQADDYEPPPPLGDAELQIAREASMAWAEEQWNPSPPSPPPEQRRQRTEPQEDSDV